MSPLRYKLMIRSISKAEDVAAFRAIAVMVFSLVMLRFHGSGKPVFSFLDLISDLGQVGYFKRRTILIDDIFHGYAMKA
jgi:hypothetical protein